MFASTTDDQVIDALLEGPNMINAFVPDPESDYNSARAQLQTIRQIVEQNRDWMDIAKHSSDARRIIGSGKLAIVLSLEMNGLSKTDVNNLIAEFGVAHIIPIHLIDNDVGGTAATSDLFNASSSLVSALYRSDGMPNRYIDIQGTTTYTRELAWPFEITSLTPVPVYANIGMIPYSAYQSSSVCYEPLSQCSGSVPVSTSYVELGHQNFRGLCTTKAECDAGIYPGEARIRDYMGEHLFVDLSHMSAHAVEQTLAIDAGLAGGFPFIASHGDFTLVHPGEGPSTSGTWPAGPRGG